MAMTTFHYRIDFSHRTYTGTVTADARLVAHTKAESTAMPAIMKDYGYTYAEAVEAFARWGETTVSEEPIEERRPVLINILTGEKTVGEPGMSEEQLFELMACGD